MRVCLGQPNWVERPLGCSSCPCECRHDRTRDCKHLLRVVQSRQLPPVAGCASRQASACSLLQLENARQRL